MAVKRKSAPQGPSTNQGSPRERRVKGGALRPAADSPTNTGRPSRKKLAGRATIRSVAARAGVSIATVSFVLNDRPGQAISAPVRKRVLEAARDLDYTPSAAASNLARKHSKNVAIMFYRNDHLIANQFYSFVVQGAVKEAAEKEYNIMFSFIHDEYKDTTDLPKVVREKNADGVLFLQSVQPDLVAEIKRRGLSVVAVDCDPRMDGLDTVEVANHRGGRLACGHLLDLGHENIVMLTAHAEAPSIKDRREGFVRELKERGLRADSKKVIIRASAIDFFSGYQKAKEVLARRGDVTGIFCANDEMAAGVLRAAHELGRSVPGDLSVIGFDDIIMSHYVDPPLSTVSFDKEAMGRHAMSRLLHCVKEGPTGVAQETLDVELVVRESTGPVRS